MRVEPFHLLEPLHLVAALLLLLILFYPGGLQRLLDALKNSRGGPPTPMHPSPTGDSALLRRRLRKVERERNPTSAKT
jgi:hypothetical protein